MLARYAPTAFAACAGPGEPQIFEAARRDASVSPRWVGRCVRDSASLGALQSHRSSRSIGGVTASRSFDTAAAIARPRSASWGILLRSSCDRRCGRQPMARSGPSRPPDRRSSRLRRRSSALGRGQRQCRSSCFARAPAHRAKDRQARVPRRRVKECKLGQVLVNHPRSRRSVLDSTREARRNVEACSAW